MEIIDNISHLLGDDLKQSLRPGARLKVAASCFSMYADVTPHLSSTAI